MTIASARLNLKSRNIYSTSASLEGLPDVVLRGTLAILGHSIADRTMYGTPAGRGLFWRTEWISKSFRDAPSSLGSSVGPSPQRALTAGTRAIVERTRSFRVLTLTSLPRSPSLLSQSPSFLQRSRTWEPRTRSLCRLRRTLRRILPVGLKMGCHVAERGTNRGRYRA
jgi:hypothetical protein